MDALGLQQYSVHLGDREATLLLTQKIDHAHLFQTQHGLLIETTLAPLFLQRELHILLVRAGYSGRVSLVKHIDSGQVGSIE